MTTGTKANVLAEITAVAHEANSNPALVARGGAVAAVTIAHAQAFISTLPVDLPLPEVATEDDGALSLDWIFSRGCRLSLSIDSSKAMPYAWLNWRSDPREGCGMLTLTRKFPTQVRDILSSLIATAATDTV